MRLAMKDGGLTTTDIQYINAHGTSTPINDPNETAAIREVFGAHAERLLVSSTKSMTGHLLGASGAAEAAVCAMMIHRGVVHQTLNHEVPGEGCDLNYVASGPVEMKHSGVLSNSLGFGGHNCTLAFKRME
jgi:3-oxoacyl-[acyl-carrier-protein] synthase II